MQKKIKIVTQAFCMVNIAQSDQGFMCLSDLFSLILSCSGTKFLKEGESFYTGAEINFDTQGKRVGRKKILRRELQEYIQPKPNKNILGMRTWCLVLFYCRHS